MNDEKKMKIIDIEGAGEIKKIEISSLSVDKMSSKELKTEVEKLRELLNLTKKENHELKEVVNKLTQEKEKATSVLDEERKEAIKVRKRALDQADTILADAKEAAEKLMAFAKNVINTNKEERQSIPGPDTLDLDELLSKPFHQTIKEGTEIEEEESKLEEQISEVVPQEQPKSDESNLEEQRDEVEKKSWDYISPREKHPSIYESKTGIISDEAEVEKEAKEESEITDNRIEDIHQRILNDYFK